jgi:hypothetical protein
VVAGIANGTVAVWAGTGPCAVSERHE